MIAKAAPKLVISSSFGEALESLAAAEDDPLTNYQATWANVPWVFSDLVRIAVYGKLPITAALGKVIDDAVVRCASSENVLSSIAELVKTSFRTPSA